MKRIREKLDNILDLIVKYYIYWAIFGLISYMILNLFFKFIEFINKLFEAKELTETLTEEQKAQVMINIQHNLLHNIAFTIVLVKAYTILMEYAKTKHINLKYTLEIAIIAPIIEIIFNYSSYTFEMIIFYGVSAVLFSIIYLFFYENLQKVEKDYKENHK